MGFKVIVGVGDRFRVRVRVELGLEVGVEFEFGVRVGVGVGVSFGVGDGVKVKIFFSPPLCNLTHRTARTCPSSGKSVPSLTRILALGSRETWKFFGGAPPPLPPFIR